MTKEAKSELQAAEKSDLAEGLDALEAAAIADDMSRAALAAGASDITRGVDAVAAAERAAVLSEVVAAAGVADVSQGIELLVSSEDIAVQSELVKSMSEQDLSLGMNMAAIAGQLEAVADVALMLEMPTLAEFLDTKSDELQDMAVETIMRFSAARALAASMRETGVDVAALGANEVAEGLTRMAVSGEMAAQSEALAEAGAEMAAMGMAGVAVSEGLREGAAELAAEGIAQMIDRDEEPKSS
ncbi:MAG: hypothetical protein GXP42_04035 [Chloroflexi bacterium]|nr:hypothetical protein [Chloroflexota bacterium]